MLTIVSGPRLHKSSDFRRGPNATSFHHSEIANSPLPGSTDNALSPALRNETPASTLNSPFVPTTNPLPTHSAPRARRNTRSSNLISMASKGGRSTRYPCPVFEYERQNNLLHTCTGRNAGNFSDLRTHMLRSSGRHPPHLSFLKSCNVCQDDILDPTNFDQRHGQKCQDPQDQRRGAAAHAYYPIFCVKVLSSKNFDLAKWKTRKCDLLIEWLELINPKARLKTMSKHADHQVSNARDGQEDIMEPSSTGLSIAGRAATYEHSGIITPAHTIQMRSARPVVVMGNMENKGEHSSSVSDSLIIPETCLIDSDSRIKTSRVTLHTMHN
jgi:hypothetical protein